jgi:hypothetical protein
VQRGIDRLGFAEHQHHATRFIKDHLMGFRPPEHTSTGPFANQDRDALRALGAATGTVGLRIDHDAHAGGLDAEGLFRHLRGIKSLALVIGSTLIPVKGQRNVRRVITRGHHGARTFPAAVGVADAGDVAEVELGIDIEMLSIPQRSPFDQPFPVLMEPLRFEIDLESQILRPCRTA